METQSVSADEANVSDADTVRDPSSLVQTDSASEATSEASAAALESTEVPVLDPAIAASIPTEPKPSYVKLAMRNMVRKRGLSLQHFALTTIGLLAFMVGLSYLTR